MDEFIADLATNPMARFAPHKHFSFLLKQVVADREGLFLPERGIAGAAHIRQSRLDYGLHLSHFFRRMSL